MQYKFPQNHRLKSKSQFQLVFQNGKKLSLGKLAIFFISNSFDYPRLGLSVAKRNVPNAADRNRIKRLVRESFRLQQELLSGNDIIVVAYAGITGLDNGEISACLITLWQKLSVYPKPQ
jgi:ribonuclease P protein component